MINLKPITLYKLIRSLCGLFRLSTQLPSLLKDREVLSKPDSSRSPNRIELLKPEEFSRPIRTLFIVWWKTWWGSFTIEINNNKFYESIDNEPDKLDKNGKVETGRVGSVLELIRPASSFLDHIFQS